LNIEELENDWPLEETKITVFFKVNDIFVYHHQGETPYYQIAVGGFILDSMGGVLFGDIQLSAADGDITSKNELEKLYAPGVIHLLESNNFAFSDTEHENLEQVTISFTFTPYGQFVMAHTGNYIPADGHQLVLQDLLE
jgi:hypothetical protein